MKGGRFFSLRTGVQQVQAGYALLVTKRDHFLGRGLHLLHRPLQLVTGGTEGITATEGGTYVW